MWLHQTLSTSNKWIYILNVHGDIKGFGDRARSLCDENSVNEELENGYTKDKIEECLSEKQPNIDVEKD